MFLMVIIHALGLALIPCIRTIIIPVIILILDACHVHLYLAYLLLNMSLTLFLGVQTPQVTTMRSRQVRRSLAKEEREWRADNVE